MNFFNNYYLRNQSGLNKFLEYCKNNKKLKDLILKNENKIKTIFEVYKKDLNNFAEILDIVDIYFDKNFKLDQNEVFSDEFKSLYKDFLNSISNIDNWDRENIQNTISDFLNLKNIKFPILGKPIRFLMTNSYNGPSISDIFLILGKKDSIDRLNQYIEKN